MITVLNIFIQDDSMRRQKNNIIKSSLLSLVTWSNHSLFPLLPNTQMEEVSLITVNGYMEAIWMAPLLVRFLISKLGCNRHLPVASAHFKLQILNND